MRISAWDDTGKIDFHVFKTYIMHNIIVFGFTATY